MEVTGVNPQRRPVRSFVIREHENWLTASENAVMRYGLFGVVVVAAASGAEWILATADHDSVARFMAWTIVALVVVMVICLAAAIRPWHYQVRIDRDETVCVVRRLFLVLPLSARAYDLSGRKLYAGSVRFVDTRPEEVVAVPSIPWRVAFFLVEFPFSILPLRENRKLVRVESMGAALRLRTADAGESVAILRVQSNAELSRLLNAAARVVPAHVIQSNEGDAQ